MEDTVATSEAASAVAHDIEAAVALMRKALILLDRAGEGYAAARLQHAIDTAERRGPAEPTQQEIDRALGPCPPA